MNRSIRQSMVSASLSPLSIAVVLLASLQMLIFLQWGCDASPYNLANYRNAGKRSSLSSHQSSLLFPIAEDFPLWYDLLNLPSSSFGGIENSPVFRSPQHSQSTSSGLEYLSRPPLENSQRDPLQGSSVGPANKRSAASCMWKSSCSNFDSPSRPLSH
ncbi:uncharacterized protein LOC134854740 [Symsagittifera roscoffensis]|uniref:uncharacterized protein LOC134854740 n=1 Tax=Symsagittifera roscoffensis TaxID=84072 RepID=UPI00307B54E5